MAPEGVKRRIAAILSADVAGYSKLMETDEVATVQTIESYRKTVTSLIEQHNGRVIDSPGDNLLSEFGSVVDAVGCAVEIQHVIRARNAMLPGGRRMAFRIGIHLGDVIEEEDRVYGDSVNIASRIEGLAAAGGVCISSSAYEQIATKLPLGYEDIGEHSVKNITAPVHVYRIPMEADAAAGAPARGNGMQRFRWVAWVSLVLAAGIAVGIGAVTIRNHYHKTPSTPAVAQQETAVTPSQKPSVAVLPFKNMSGDPEQEYFSDGISEEILNGLAKSPALIVKGSASSFKFKGRNEDIRKIGEMLNVTHVVDGSVRKSGNRIRVTAQLIATSEDTHIWSDRYDRELTEVFAVQDAIAGSVLNALNIHLLGSEEGRAPTASVEAYNAYLLGRYQYNRAQLDEAVRSFEQAVSLDPDYADAYGALALAHNLYVWWSRNPARDKLPVIRGYIDRALALNGSQPDALNAKIWVRFLADRAYQDAITEMTELVRKHPNDIDILLYYGCIFQTIGRFDLAFMVFERMELDPLSPIAHFARGANFLLAERFQEARESFRKMALLGLNDPVNFAWLAFHEGNVEAIKEQLDLGKSHWEYSSHWYPFYEATVSYLNGDAGRIEEIFGPLWQSTSYLSHYAKSYMALLEGDLDLALNYYSQALSDSEYVAFRDIQAPLFRVLYPEYRSHPRYLRMLHDVGLDEESIAKLEIPPLPF